MFWTHTYDLIVKVVILLLSLLILIQIPFFEQHGIICITTSLMLFYFTYYFFFRTLSTFFYCRFTLKMNVSLSQAKQLNDAFSPVSPFNMKWLPMDEIKRLDDSVKFVEALKIYKSWNEESIRNKKERILNIKKVTLKIKLLKVLYFILVGYFITAGFLNLPPANFLTDIMNNIFESDGYNPILNSCILILPISLIFRLINKDILG